VTIARPSCRRLARVIAGITLLAIPLGASAQSRAAHRPSAYIPLDDPATAIIDALVARGQLPTLSSLERPYRAGDVDDAISRLDSSEVAAGAHGPASWYASARRAARRYARPLANADSGIRLSASIVPFVTAQTTGRRELMLADSAGDGIYPGGDVRLALDAPSVIGLARLRIDRALTADPEFAGKSDRAAAARMEDAYIAARWRYAALDAGRVARNWGPSALNGLQLGHYADSYDHVQLVLGVDRLHLTTIAARLDDITVTTDTVAQRFFSIHRLSARWRALEIAASEAVVYGGPARGFEPALANPFSLFNLAQYDEKQSLNASYGLDVALRTRGRGLYVAQLLVDDFQLDRCGAACTEPASLGGTVTAEAVPLPGALAVAFGSYTRVNNLTYRTVSAWERYTSLGLGLGAGQSDYDELRVGVELAPPLGGPLRVYAAHRRQGEGDYRLRFPDVAEYPATPAIFAGVVEKVTRLGGSWSTSGTLSWTADVGYQWTRNADHLSGRTRNGFEGRVRLSLTDGLRFARTIDD
jgi:hypothetical protein